MNVKIFISNVCYKDKSQLQMLAKQLLISKPDIIFLQEMYSGIEDLVKILKSSWLHVQAHFHHIIVREGFFYQPTDIWPNNFFTIISLSNNFKCIAINVHLTEDEYGKNLEVDYKYRTQYLEKQSAYLSKHYADYPIIFAGDFNSNSTIKCLKSDDYTIVAEDDMESTWPVKISSIAHSSHLLSQIKDGDSSARIDFIAYKNIPITSSKYQIYPHDFPWYSDHEAILCELSIDTNLLYDIDISKLKKEIYEKYSYVILSDFNLKELCFNYYSANASEHWGYLQFTSDDASKEPLWSIISGLKSGGKVYIADTLKYHYGTLSLSNCLTTLLSYNYLSIHSNDCKELARISINDILAK